MYLEAEAREIHFKMVIFSTKNEYLQKEQTDQADWKSCLFVISRRKAEEVEELIVKRQARMSAHKRRKRKRRW